MSFVCVTFGYNQHALFNLKTSVNTLIDNIRFLCFSSVEQKIRSRESALSKELDILAADEDALRRSLRAAEAELVVEEEKYAESLKLLEARRKREEAEEKKKARKKDGKDAKEERKEKDKDGKNAAKKKGKKGGGDKGGETEEDNKAIVDLKEKISKLNSDIQTISGNKNILNDKKKKLQEVLAVYKKKNREKMTIKIDLVDSKGEQMLIYNKGNIWASECLADKTVYELWAFNVPSSPPPENENQKKKKDKKKETQAQQQQQQEEKDKDNNNGNNNNNMYNTGNMYSNVYYESPNMVWEPVKFDGYCIRTIKEDEEFEEGEKKDSKDNKKNKKK